MSGLTARLPAPRAAEAAAVPARDSALLRLAAFAALAAWASGHWATLVEGTPVGRTLLVVVVATGGATALVALRRSGLAVWRVRGLAAMVALLMLLLGLLAAGLSLELLLPGGWDEFADGLDRGLGGIQSVSWPYDGNDDWVRLAIQLGAPLLVAVSAALAFWPTREPRPSLRAAGLVLLLVLYGTAVTEHDPGEPLLRGLVLLGLVAAWLWLPALPLREGLLGAAVVGLAGLSALPLAAALDGDTPWWDYRAWNWFGGGEAITFDWSHRYGPLNWPRDGTTLLNIESDRPHYWKAETLDRFDGFRWLRSPESAAIDPASELPDRLSAEGPSWQPFEFNPRWDQRVRVTVRALESNLLVGPGTTYSVRGAGAYSSSGDGTTRKDDVPLERGDSYVVRGYAPDPSAVQMREAPKGYASGLARYTALFLPRAGETAIEGIGRQGDASRSAAAPRRAVFVPLRGDPLTGSPAAAGQLARSPYGRVARLARRVSAGAPSSYDAVKAVERHLRRNYTYNEQPPSQEYPLASFLFEDRIGYCQQFSGAMALMLRSIGIPTRVASGFSPGSFNRDSGEYRIRDLDAHSWVEVYFTGIGWVPFDPTPDASPAEAQAAGDNAPSAASALNRDNGASQAAPEGGDRSERGGRGEGGGGGPAPLVIASLTLLVLLAGVGIVLTARRSSRQLGTSGKADAQLRELRRALERLGWGLPAGTTLLGLERRLGRAVGPHSAGYSARLREHRYSPRSVPPPGATERRALRRELAAGGGLRARLRAVLALPPGGPRGG